jgi:hypothetical protein
VIAKGGADLLEELFLFQNGTFYSPYSYFTADNPVFAVLLFFCGTYGATM